MFAMFKRIALTGLCLLVVIGLAIAFILSHPPKDLETNNPDSGLEESHENHANTAEAPASAAERAFLEDMIPHHQEAVDTAKAVLARSSNPEVRDLAQNMVTTQEKEIADMKRWYQNWYNTAYSDSGTYTPMMPDLSNLADTEFDRAFLKGMIDHHLHALMLGQQVAPAIQHSEVRTLVESIAKTQSNEIITMRILLKQL